MGCNLSAQCSRVLALLSNLRAVGSVGEAFEVTIPYFGVVVKRRQNVPTPAMPRRERYPVILPKPLDPWAISAPMASPPHFEDPILEYLGYDLLGSGIDNMFDGHSMNTSPVDDLSSWINIDILDMGQDGSLQGLSQDLLE